ncbi:hypothetical protein LOY64_18655 [Pseudomonas corrugata]|uniref:Uncharacterized protein n=1 Tax=Pseudomonas corrugata TaxID=47879 RepID=A0A3M3EED8_9PSED|nr:hypothetical protein [Pseudomonas corrugata]MDU9023265.1 hypothetical protein [Pseudomonas corrugata]MDU9035344.1 hypothetical protein [Pseudomonas corrugata]MDU9037944.1 hypothetical protein [Pseudomonas corrugata]QTH12232.1 hypothetical protein C4C32_16670 [Pseudomonas corrugata]RMM47940.1 hypothetical protein ALQ77_04083 [Pseudomonas corrugata]
MPQFNEQTKAAPLLIDGIANTEPARVPRDVLFNGTTGRVPRPLGFPTQPGEDIKLTVYWEQPNKTEIFQRTYTSADSQPEFPFPITPQQMSVDGQAIIYYEWLADNPDNSPRRTLIIDHTLVPTLEEPDFPDRNLYGYLNCSSSPPIWEKIRVQIGPESVFEELDECVLEWQGFGTLNGAPPALTPLYEFRKILTRDEALNGFIMEIPFDPYVKPMMNNDSGRAQYTIIRNNVPIAKSKAEVVKIDRIIPGQDEPCGGFA